jgi:hypothetical protein
MPALLFDHITLLGDGLCAVRGEEHTFRDLGFHDHETLRVLAREVVLAGVPARSIELAADRLVVADPGPVVVRPDRAGVHLRFVAQHIEGRVHIGARPGDTQGQPDRGGSVTVWYTTASPAPTVDRSRSGVEVIRVPDPQELWTWWQTSQAHAVSNVAAIGAELI